MSAIYIDESGEELGPLLEELLDDSLELEEMLSLALDSLELSIELVTSEETIDDSSLEDSLEEHDSLELEEILSLSLDSLELSIVLVTSEETIDDSSLEDSLEEFDSLELIEDSLEEVSKEEFELLDIVESLEFELVLEEIFVFLHPTMSETNNTKSNLFFFILISIP